MTILVWENEIKEPIPDLYRDDTQIYIVYNPSTCQFTVSDGFYTDHIIIYTHKPLKWAFDGFFFYNNTKHITFVSEFIRKIIV